MQQLFLVFTTIGSLTTHVRRAHYIAMIWIKASGSHPCLPSLTEFDWTIDATTKRFDPVRCLHPPAPEAMMKLVKCGCKKGCTGNCSCRNNKIPCTESKLQRLGFLPRNSLHLQICVAPLMKFFLHPCSGTSTMYWRNSFLRLKKPHISSVRVLTIDLYLWPIL